MAARVGYSVPATVRANFPVVGANYSIPAADLGVVAAKPGITITLPPIAGAQRDGTPYSVKNISGGNITIVPAGSDVFTTGAGSQTSESIYTESDQDFIIESTTSTWILI